MLYLITVILQAESISNLFLSAIQLLGLCCNSRERAHNEKLVLRKNSEFYMQTSVYMNTRRKIISVILKQYLIFENVKYFPCDIFHTTEKENVVELKTTHRNIV